MKKRILILLLACSMWLCACNGDIFGALKINRDAAEEADDDEEDEDTDEDADDEDDDIDTTSDSKDSEKETEREKSSDRKSISGSGSISKKKEADTSETEDSFQYIVNPGDFSFADLSNTYFIFSSGVGAWQTDFHVFDDGFFRGSFYDADMGSIGEGYENGTVYCCSFSGHFSEPQMIDDYTYEVDLMDISFRDEVGTWEISPIDNVYYEYTDAYGFNDSEKFLIYLPGRSVDDISEEVMSWNLNTWGRDSDVLEEYMIVNEACQYGMCSEMYSLVDDTLIRHESTISSYDEIMEMCNTAPFSQMEYNYAAWVMYRNNDTDLNYIWDAIKYTCDEETMEELLPEQRQWIKDKEEEARQAAAGNEGGSIYDMVYYGRLAALTMERANELIKYLE